MSYQINKEDILKRVYFIIKLVQSQKGDTMQGALTSKSDSMGGIFDRFINSLSEDVVFNKILLPEIEPDKKVEIVNDYYLYKPTSNGAGIAPDVFGFKINEKTIPFVQFNKKWNAIKNMPQIEVKTFKAKDQMISLRNQRYDDLYLVLTDLRLRIDYLVPFFDKNLLKDDICTEMAMDDSAFIAEDNQNKISKISKIDFSSDKIGEIDIISITKGSDFLNQATLCGPGISPRRVKEIRKRKKKLNSSTNHRLNEFCQKSPRINGIYEFTDQWYEKTNINKEKTIYVDFSASKIDQIEICCFNTSSVVIKALDNGCKFNEVSLEKDKQYIVDFATLERSGNGGSEYFMQKQCAVHLNNRKKELIDTLKDIINNN